MKKIITVLLTLILMLGVAGCSGSEADKSIPGTSSSTEKKSKILVVYFSMPETTNPNNMTPEEDNSAVVIDGKVLGNTQYVAQLIQANTGADIFRIEPQTPYPTNHKTLVDLAKDEQTNRVRPALAKKIENIGQYDIIFVGYPIWWADMPMVLYSFFEGTDLSGKKIIPFSTHGGSGFADTISTIQRLEPNANVATNGFTVSRNNVANSKSDVVSWVKSFNLK